MLFSCAWLREIVDLEGIGVQEAAAALTARGLAVDSVSADPEAPVLDLDVPANRPDCLGHVGVARELAAAFSRSLFPRPGAPPAAGASIADEARVSVADPDLCSRYTARLVRGVRVGPSPREVVARLEACGLRSINNVVDVSNLVLLETGHPIHTFDFRRIRDAHVLVRRAIPGETIETLDGVVRPLDSETLVIADAARPIAIAGVLGGADTEIRPTSSDVLVEAAVFDPRSVRRTARRLGLATDASHRFERGVDPNAAPAVQDLAVRLLCEIAGGVAAPGRIDVHPPPPAPRRIVVRPERARLLLGYDPGEARMREALLELGLSCEHGDPGRIEVTPPSWRIDLVREEDFIEEIARHLGYDRIPVGPEGAATPPLPDPLAGAEERARTLASKLGFHEACSYAMNAEGEDDPFVEPSAPPQISLTNPIAEPLARLRRSVLPGLLRALDRNAKRGAEDVRLFEVGSVFLRASRGGFPDERPRLGIAWAGAGTPRHWSKRPRDVDFFDLSGAVGAILDAFRPGERWVLLPTAILGLHPGRSTGWAFSSEEIVAWGGEVHPDTAEALDLSVPAFVAEIDLGRLVSLPESVAPTSPIPRVPAVSRDLSLVLLPGIPCSRLLSALETVEAPAPVRFEAVDRYEGAPLVAGESSLTVRVILQPLDVTLTESRVEAYRSALIQAAEERVGARLRG